MIHQGIILICNLCETTFRSKKALKRHEKSFHVAGQIISCDECSKFFGKTSSLKKHIEECHNSHNGFSANIDKPYTCLKCRGFTKDDLLAHYDNKICIGYL